MEENNISKGVLSHITPSLKFLLYTYGIVFQSNEFARFWKLFYSL